MCVCVYVYVYILQNKYGKLSLEITSILFCVKIWHCIKHQKLFVVKNLQYKENYFYSASLYISFVSRFQMHNLMSMLKKGVFQL